MTLIKDLFDLGSRLQQAGCLPPEGFEQTRCELVIHLSASGEIGIVKTEKGARRLLPRLKRSGSKPPPLLISDKLQFVTAWPKADTDAERAKALHRHSAYLDLLRSAQADSSTGDDAAALAAIVRAVEDPDRLQELIQKAIGEPPPKGWPVCSEWKADFVVAGQPVFAPDGTCRPMDSLIRFWTKHQATHLRGTGDDIPCAVTGIGGPPARVVPSTTLAGTPGNPPSLVSVNINSGRRYGRDQAGGSGLTAQTASVATQAFNWLLDQQAADRYTHRVDLAEATAVLWTPEDVSLSLAETMDDPQPEALAAMRKSYWSTAPAVAPTWPVHSALVAVNVGRVQVLADHTITLKEFVERNLAWQQSMDPVRRAYDAPDGKRRVRTGIRSLAKAAHGVDGVTRKAKTQRDSFYKPVGRTAAVLYRCALESSPLPVSVRNATIDRCTVGSMYGDKRIHVTPEQAALLHLYAHTQKETPMQNKAATLCGRIFAELERTQDQALGDVNAGVSRTYAAAAGTPKRVFARLIERRMSHIRKLQRDNPGAAVNADKEFSSLMVALQDEGGFPQRLDASGRADFALGYFHQRQKRYQKTEQAKHPGDSND